MDKKLMAELKSLKGFDIDKMSVEEFAQASEDNKLMQAMIWTKAYTMEKELLECSEWMSQSQHLTECEAEHYKVECTCGLDKLLRILRKGK